jgi:hypothetical protein
MSGQSFARHRRFLSALVVAAASPALAQPGCLVPPNECIGPWSDSGLPEVVSGPASAVVRYNGDLYVATQMVEGRPTGGIVRALNGRWVEVGGGLSALGADSPRVDDLEVWDPDGPGPQQKLLVVVGRFDFAGAIGVQNIAIWNGSVWSTFDGGLPGNGTHLVEVWDRSPTTPLLVATIAMTGAQEGVVGFDTPTSAPALVGAFNADHGTLGEIHMLEAIDPDGPGAIGTRLFIGGTIGGIFPIPNRPLKSLTLPTDTWNAVGNFPGNGASIEVRGLAAADLDGPAPTTTQLFAIGSNLHDLLAGSQSIAIGTFADAATSWTVISGAPSGFFPRDILRIPDADNPGVGPDALLYAGAAEGNTLFHVTDFASNFTPMNVLGISDVRDARVLSNGPGMQADIAVAGEFLAPPSIMNAAVARIRPGPLFSLLPLPLLTQPGLRTVDEVTAFARSLDPQFPDMLLIAHTGPTFGGVISPNLTAWDGEKVLASLGAPIDPGARINAIASLDLDGPGPLPNEIVIGGDFETVAGAPAEALAVLRAGDWISTFGDFAPANGGEPVIDDILDGAGSLFAPFHVIAGSFGPTATVPGNNIGLYSEPSGWSANAAFNQGTNGPIHSALIFNGLALPPSALVVGGRFTMAGTSPGGPLAVFTQQSGQWFSLGSFTPGSVINKVLAWDHDDNNATLDRLIIAGDFNSFSATDIAEFNGDTFDAPGNSMDLPLGEVFDAAIFDPDGPGPEAEWLVVVGPTNEGCDQAPAAPALFGLQPFATVWIPVRDAFDRSVCEGPRRLFVHDDDNAGPAGDALFLGGSGFTIENGSALGIAKLPSVQPGLWIDCSVNEIDDPTAYACMIPADSNTPFVHDRTLLGRTSDNTHEVKVFFNHVAESFSVRSDVVNLTIGNNLAGRGDPTPFTAGPAPDGRALVVGGRGLPAALRVAQPAANGSFFVTGDAIIGANTINNEVNTQILILSNGIPADISGDLIIGSAGGLLVVETAASLITHGEVRIGIEAGSIAAALLEGTSWFADAGPSETFFVIGGEGIGTLTVRDGATFTSTASLLSIATGANGVGRVEIEGAETTFDWLGGPITVGVAGDGLVRASRGAQAFSHAATINVGGAGPASRGLFEILSNSEGTLWNGSTGQLNVGTAAGDGLLRVQDTATIIMNRIDIGPNGRLEGDGAVSAATLVRNAGDVAPGTVGGVATLAADLDLLGAYVQVSAADNAGIPGRLLIDIAGPLPTDADRIDVTGVATLGGHLDVRFSPGYLPAPGDLTAGVPVVQANSITGTFDVGNFPGLPPTVTGAPRFLRFETRLSPRGVFPASIVVVEDTLATPPPAATQSQDFDAGGAGTDAALGDLDGDLDNDLAITIPDAVDPASGPGSVVILLNAGTLNGFWLGFTSTQQITVEPNPASILIADFDGLNGNDIAYSTLSDNAIHVLLNDGSGNFAPLRGVTPPEVVAGDPGHLIKSDFNQAGGTDIAVVTADPDTCTILFNSRDTGGGFIGFPISETIPIPPAETAGVASDIDNDKWDDVIVPDEDADSATIIGNDGPKLVRGGLVFDPVPISISVPGDPVDVDSADLDNDGFRDLAFATRTGDSVAILLGQGTRSFLPPLTIPAGDAPSRLVLADLDNDADRDLAVVTSNTQQERTVRVIRNDLFGGLLGFAPQADLEPGATPELVLAGDVTGDGQSDLVTINDAGGIGRPRGAPMNSDVSVFTFAACLGDANNDRLVDMKDITSTLTNWLANYNPGTGPGDCNADSQVNFEDITCTLSSFGRDCR